MIEIKIPSSIKIGSIDYSIDISEAIREDLIARQRYGECNHYSRNIRIDNKLENQPFMQTFIHECMEAIDVQWCNNSLTHEQITNVANAIHQILDQLDIRFIK